MYLILDSTKRIAEILEHPSYVRRQANGVVVLSDRKREIHGQDFVVFRFTVENSVETGASIRAWQKGETPHDGYTRGLYYRGWEQC